MSEPEPAVVEERAAEYSASPSEYIPVVAHELHTEATVEVCPGAGAVPVEQSERAEVDALLGWLSDAELPHEPFQLWSWLRVTDVARFVVMLQTELSSDVPGPRWRGAAEDLRQVARLYRGVGGEKHPGGNSNWSQPATGWSARQSHAPPASRPPLLMSNVRTGRDQSASRRVRVGGARVG